jgi:hypothetical protein
VRQSANGDCPPHDAVDNQREEADQCVGANAFGQAVVDGRNLDVALEHPEATFDIGQ